MANPTVTSFSLDQSAYASGELMTLTMVYNDPDSEVLTASSSLLDASGNAAGVLQAIALIDPLIASASSVPARTWTKISDNGSVAVFTATA